MAQRLTAAGIVLAPGQPTITAVRPGSEAARQKLRPGDKIETVSVLATRPSPFLFAIPAMLALLGMALLQRRRRAASAVPATR
jgi:hypothetical protein